MLKNLKKGLWDELKNGYLSPTLFIFFIFSIFSCTPQDETITLDTGAALAFSADTVLFDTVFTSVGSYTKRVKIYNRNKNAVNIEKLSLGKAEASPYELKIYGESGTEFRDVYLLGGDSLMLLISVTIDPQDQNLPFLVKDSIVFRTNNNFQDIKLVSYGQDAHFLGDVILPCNTEWTANRPYVIYSSILIDSLCELRINKGARIYFNNNAALYVKGTLIAEGDVENNIIFTNQRQDGSYKNAPGQWKGIYFLEGSKENIIDFAQIRNAEIGLRVGTPDNDTIPDVILSNTKIENMSSAGLLAFSSDIKAFNVLINNCGDYTVGNFAGGHYTYEHCTFANFNYVFTRQNPSVVFSDNIILADNTLLEEDLTVNLHNSIIWGTLREEMLLSHSGSAVFVFNASHNIIRSSEESYNINNNIINNSQVNFPKFKKPDEYNYMLDSLSPAINAGRPLEVKKDILGNVRKDIPDIGTYERAKF